VERGFLCHLHRTLKNMQAKAKPAAERKTTDKLPFGPGPVQAYLERVITSMEKGLGVPVSSSPMLADLTFRTPARKYCDDWALRLLRQNNDLAVLAKLAEDTFTAVEANPMPGVTTMRKLLFVKTPIRVPARLPPRTQNISSGGGVADAGTAQAMPAAKPNIPWAWIRASPLIRGADQSPHRERALALTRCPRLPSRGLRPGALLLRHQLVRSCLLPPVRQRRRTTTPGLLVLRRLVPF